MKKLKRSPANYAYALKSFTGYLEGTHKSAHTIKNYRLDIQSFESFLTHGQGSDDRAIKLEQVSPADLERFHDYLRSLGLKTNTRRRKLLTVRRFLGYLVNRNKLPLELGKKIATPHKIERVPLTVSSEALTRAIRALPVKTLLDERNRVLLWTLAESGCQVSEVNQLRWDSWESSSALDGKPRLLIRGKSPREIPVSSDLLEAVNGLQQRAGTAPWLFLGFNKFGSMGSAITPRGVELLVKFHAAKLGQGDLTPRTFRHSAVMHWFEEGCSRDEIQKRLGLKTAYAFRTFEPLFKSHERSKSTN